MRETPILFSAPMVRALLADRKFQTRRVVKGQALEWLQPGMLTPEFTAAAANGLSPYGYAGDRLWVRETWCEAFDENDQRYTPTRYHYRADGYEVVDVEDSERSPWRPSIHMPRAASRLTLEVTDVRIQRLQDLTERDAVDEGMPPDAGLRGEDDLMVQEVIRAHDAARGTFLGMPAPVARFVLLWDALNGKQPGVTNWNANPWVWAVSFRRVTP